MTSQLSASYRVQAPFVPGREGGLHLWVHHHMQVTPAVEIQVLMHDHKHANGLADHTHTDQPEAGVTA